MKMTRRRMMQVSAASLLAMGVWPGRLRAAESATKPLKFIQVNDLHYTEEACGPFFEGLVKEFNKVEGAAFVLLTGDLADTGTAAQCSALKAILKGLKAPYFVTVGNHDHASDTDRGPFEECFGKKMNTVWEENGWQFVGMDTSDGTKYENVSAKAETVEFAASLPGKLDKDKPTFVYTHFPLGPGVQYEIKNAAKLLEPLKGLNVAAIFNGHYHGFTQKKVIGEVLVTTNVCCSRKRANHDNSWQKGFFVVEAAEGKWKRTFMEYGTDFASGAVPRKSKPNPIPARPEDGSRPWY